MKKSFIIISGLSLWLMACSSPTPIISQTNPMPKAEVKLDASPKYTSNSYLLAEPLAGKKVRISITAKDQDLYISNCNGSFPIWLKDKNNSQNDWTEVVTTCRSNDIIIPKGTTLVIERHITESHFPININAIYRATVPITYNPKLKNSNVPDDKRLSNAFKLIP